MINNLYSKPRGPFTLNELSSVSGSSIKGQKGIYIRSVNSLKSAKKGDIAFIDNPKYIYDAMKTDASAIIMSKKYLDKFNKKMNFLISDNPYLTFAKIVNHFYPNLNKETYFNNDKENHESNIQDNFLGKNVKIGKDSYLGKNSTIGPNVIIGKNCSIGNSVNISNAIIGDNVSINHGTVIGSDGFGYAFNSKEYIKVPQIGIVIIEDEVEIGCNCTIDKGSIHNTKIKKGVKIDNLVHIAHNVQIGIHTVIAGQTGIAGSTKIGKFVMIGGQVGIAGHLNIGDYVKIGAQAGVTKDLIDKSIVSGTPAVNLNSYLKQSLLLSKMVKKK